MKKLIAALAAGALLVVPAAAGAHVTLNPDTAPAKGFAELLVRVPNEMDNANTNKIDIKFPPGFVQVSYEPKPGWTFAVQKTKLAKPIQTDDGPVTEQVSRMTITGTGKGLGTIALGQFMDFALSVGIPDQAGKKLLFPTVQTYSNGKVVRWIAPDESADTPAPHLDVTAAASGSAAAAPSSTTAAPAKPAAAATTSTKDDSASKTSVIIAIVLGAIALIIGIAALVSRRRSPVAAG
jgi:periplasmic copper chaperone A